MNRREAMLALSAAGIPASDAEAQLRAIDQRLGELGSTFEQHAAIVRNTVSTEVRDHYLATVFGNAAVRAAVVLSQQPPAPDEGATR